MGGQYLGVDVELHRGKSWSKYRKPFMLSMRSYSCLPKNFEFCLYASCGSQF